MRAAARASRKPRARSRSVNTTVAAGGAIANFNNGSLHVTGCEFDYNSASSYGGALYDGQGYMSWSMKWTGNHAGLKGPNYYVAATGKAG